MATIDLDGSGGSYYDDEEERRRLAAANQPSPSQSDPNAEAHGVNEMIARDQGSWEQRLREAGGSMYDPSDLEGVIRQVSYAQNVGQDPDRFLRDAEARYRERASNTPTGSLSSSSGTLGPLNDPRLAAQQYNVFSDPLTAQYERLLQQQLAAQQGQQAQLQQWLGPLIADQQRLIQAQRAQYEQQRLALEEAARVAEQRRAQTGQAVDRLGGYINERVGKLQGPAYTGTEQEVLRTQLLDPLERDRAAAQKRAFEQISRRGFELDSGVAQELLAQVNRAFDEERSRQQGGLAQRQIEEERSRQQEAQQLLQYLAALPDATARGDLEYITYVQNLLNQPRQASLATGMAGGTGVAQLLDLPTQPGVQALGIGETLADLPAKRLNEALAALGIGPSTTGATSSLIQLLQQAQQNRAYQNANAANAWGQIGRSFMP